MTDQELLKLIIAETHYTQAQIANMVDTTRQYVGLVYNGKGNFSFRIKNKLKELFPKYFNIAKIPTELNSENIKAFRIGNQLTQSKFAGMLGISQTALARIENGTMDISDKVSNNFYRVFQKEADSQAIYYCPEVTIPNNFYIPENPEVIKVDKRLLNIEKGLIIDFSQTYLVSVSGDSLKPEYENNDRVLLDTSHTSFKNGYIYLITIESNNYVVRVNVSPDKVKCIPFDNKQDAFYLNEKIYGVKGLIVPRIRL